MIRKIKKYIKFMVCAALIFSLVAPSYAAISSTDGSVFITKAEFDSAMVDFNARLTTFEAGINSKIDSQVTSYLDKNGIWSGVEQTSLVPDGWKWNLKNHTKTDGVSNSTYDLNNIFVANKAGLCYMTYKYRINKQNTSKASFENTWGDMWSLKDSGNTVNVFDGTEVWYIVENNSTKIIAFNVTGGTPKALAVGDSNPRIIPVWGRVPSTTIYPSSVSFFAHQGSTYGMQLIQYYYMDTNYVTSRTTTYTGQMEVFDFKAVIY